MRYRRNESVSVTTTAALLSAAQPRSLIYFRNTSLGGETITITMSNSQGSAAGAGYFLSPGDTLGEAIDNNFIPWDGDITVVASGAGGVLSFQEEVMGQ